jgi:hypothetical protein
MALFGAISKREDPFFLAFTKDLDMVLVEVGVIHSQGTQLTGPDSGIQQQCDNGIPPGPRRELGLMPSTILEIS